MDNNSDGSGNEINDDILTELESLREENAALRAEKTFGGRVYGWMIRYLVAGPNLADSTEDWLSEAAKNKRIPERESGAFLSAYTRRQIYRGAVSAAAAAIVGSSVALVTAYFLQKQIDTISEQNNIERRIEYIRAIFSDWSIKDGKIYCNFSSDNNTLKNEFFRAYIKTEYERIRILRNSGVLPSLFIPNVRRACLNNIRAIGIDLSNFDFSQSDLQSADFNRSIFRNAIFHSANLSNADFFGADLRWAKMSGADVTNTSFSGADISHADFRNVVGFTEYTFAKSCGEGTQLPIEMKLPKCTD